MLEYVDGDTLTGRLNQYEGGGLRPEVAIDMCAQVARGIATAHERGIVHRDVKPANVLNSKEGIAKVLDFGIGKSMRGVVMDTGETVIDLELTSHGVLVGTVPYMSPEAVKGGEVDERSDIWAFGCVLYESLTGRSPFACDSVADTLAAILEQEPVRRRGHPRRGGRAVHRRRRRARGGMAAHGAQCAHHDDSRRRRRFDQRRAPAGAHRRQHVGRGGLDRARAHADRPRAVAAGELSAAYRGARLPRARAHRAEPRARGGQ